MEEHIESTYREGRATVRFIHNFVQTAAQDSRLLCENEEAVRRHNYTSMMSILLIASVMTIFLSAWYIAIQNVLSVGLGFLVILAINLLLLSCCQTRLIKTHPLVGLYLEVVVCMVFAIYLSVFYAPEQKASVILGLFCIVPLVLMDRLWRIDLLLGGFFILHTVLALLLKPAEIFMADIINSLGYFVLGVYLGNSAMLSRLDEMDLRRKSEVEKLVDILSGIGNRRSLFEQLAVYETNRAEQPIGALMFDIDDFKSFNDRFGHAGGDTCLRKLGSLLQQVEKECRIRFYRYGGDEFAGFAFGYDRNGLWQIAELIKTRASRLTINGRQITVSVGAAYCGGQSIPNYERLIDCADVQLYEAKAQGGNTVSLIDFQCQNES